jgi:ABC-type microcin C transport system duplicated ATPase subunit YejF
MAVLIMLYSPVRKISPLNNTIQEGLAAAVRIIVIVNGRIVEKGKHEELLALHGEYFKLHEMQFENNKHQMPNAYQGQKVNA